MEKLFPPIGLLFVTALFWWYSVNNFISHSEFWSIFSGQLWGDTSEPATVVYYKPLFYMVLKIPFLIPLSSVDHILVSRSFFGILAGVYFALVSIFVYRESKSIKITLLFSLFIMSFHTFTYNIFRVRADLLSHIFILLGLLSIQKKSENKTDAFVIEQKLLFFFLCALLSTPKAIFSVAASLLYLNSKTKKSLRLGPTLVSLSLYLIFPLFLSLSLAGVLQWSSILEENPYSLAILYFVENMGDLFSRNYWVAFTQSLKINFLHYLVILGGAGIILSGKESRFKSFATLSLFSWLLFLIYSEKWDYYLAVVLPFLSLPSLALFESVSKKFHLWALMTVLVIFPFYMTFFEGWSVPNTSQLAVVEKLENFLKLHPGTSYFDSTGLVPRFPANKSYIGYNDKESAQKAISSARLLKPEFVFYTSNMNNRKDVVMPYLFSNYVRISPNFWVRSEYLSQLEKGPWEDFPLFFKDLFIYDYRPRVRFFSNSHSTR